MENKILQSLPGIKKNISLDNLYTQFKNIGIWDNKTIVRVENKWRNASYFRAWRNSKPITGNCRERMLAKNIISLEGIRKYLIIKNSKKSIRKW